MLSPGSNNDRAVKENYQKDLSLGPLNNPISMKSHENRLNMLVFPLEKILSKFRIPYSYYSIPLIYDALFTITQMSLIFKIAPPDLARWELVYWILPSALIFPLIFFAMKYMRDKSIQFIRKLKDFLREEDFGKINDFL